MMENATLLRIDRRTGLNGAGTLIFTPGLARCIRCWAEDVVVEKFTGAARVEDATAVVFVPAEALAAASETTPANGDRITYQMDGDSAPVTEEVVTAKNRRKESLSHIEVFTRAVPGGGAA